MGCNASKVRELREMLAARDQEMDQLLERKNREVATLKWQKATTESTKTAEALKAKQEAQDATIRLFEQQESNRLLKRANAQLTAEFSIMKESTRQTEIVASSQVKLAEVSLERATKDFERRRSKDHEQFNHLERKYKGTIAKVSQEKDEVVVKHSLLARASYELARKGPTGTGGTYT